MSKRFAVIGILSTIVAIGGVTMTRLAGQVAPAQSELPSCEWNEALFPEPSAEELKKGMTAEIWSKEYHARVREILAAHFAPPGADLTCTVQPVRAASMPLRGLAEYLSPWNVDGGGSLLESDMGSVLLEYLRTYECTLRARWFLLPTVMAEELGSIDELLNGSTDDGDGGTVGISDFVNSISEEERQIQKELALARRALHRTLTAITGEERLAPLEGTTECLARVSMDLSNEMGLAAGVSACLPARTWDTKGSLLDLKK